MGYMGESWGKGIQETRNEDQNGRTLSSYVKSAAARVMSALKACRCITTLVLIGLAVNLILPQLISFETSFQVIRITVYFARIQHRPYNPAQTETSIGQIFSALDTLGKEGWKRPIFGAIVSASFDMFTLYFFFIAAGYAIEPEILIVGYGLPPLLGKMAFLLPGGVGVVESIMAALYTGLGVPGSIAVVVTLSYKIFSFWIPTVVGFPLAFYLQEHEILK